MARKKIKGLLNTKLEDPAYRKRFELGMLILQLVSDIQLELERRDWPYTKLAKILNTQKSNISRDLNGGLKSATLYRLKRYADALGLECQFRMVKKP